MTNDFLVVKLEADLTKRHGWNDEISDTYFFFRLGYIGGLGVEGMKLNSLMMRDEVYLYLGGMVLLFIGFSLSIFWGLWNVL